MRWVSTYDGAMQSDGVLGVSGAPVSARGRRVAVIGAGVAGATCARRLAEAGWAVEVFDKSRGVGGRLATRRAEWPAADGTLQPARFDHGAPGFGAQTPDFVRCVEQAAREGWLARWSPRLAARSHVPLKGAVLWLPTPDMPALCRAWLAGVMLHTNCLVDALLPGPAGWRLQSAGATVGEGFDAVILAIPPQQAAPLLQPHRPDWAQRAVDTQMLPQWVLMAVTDDAPAADHVSIPVDGDLAWPTSGPLAVVVRNDAKPGRARLPGQAQWVAQATAEWSQTHLESSTETVKAALQAALAQWWGRPVIWHHSAVHRWRYATVSRATPGRLPPPERCQWDAALGLGVCGDALGGAGVEGAWVSARALAVQVLEGGCPAGLPR